DAQVPVVGRVLDPGLVEAAGVAIVVVLVLAHEGADADAPVRSGRVADLELPLERQVVAFLARVDAVDADIPGIARALQAGEAFPAPLGLGTGCPGERDDSGGERLHPGDFPRQAHLIAPR